MKRPVHSLRLNWTMEKYEITFNLYKERQNLSLKYGRFVSFDNNISNRHWNDTRIIS